MTTKQIKSNIHKVVDDIDDEQLLQEINLLIQNSVTGTDDEMWNELPSEVKAGIEEGLRQANAGKTISNKEFKTKFKKWFSK